MRNVLNKRNRENQNTHFIFDNLFAENCAVYEIMWKNIVELCRPQMTILCLRIACWIPKATDTNFEYIMLIDFPRNSGYTNEPHC